MLGFCAVGIGLLKKKDPLGPNSSEGEKMFRTLSESCFLTARSSYLRNFVDSAKSVFLVK